MHGAKESHNSIHGMKPPVLTVGSGRASQSKTASRCIKSTANAHVAQKQASLYGMRYP